VTLAEAVTAEVRRRMTARGLSARELARQSGMPATLVHRALAGARPFGLDELGQIAAVLGVHVVWLIDSATRTASPDRVTCSQSNSEPRQV
jgi:transcriptional regulator with XRE-family HTH domain